MRLRLMGQGSGGAEKRQKVGAPQKTGGAGRTNGASVRGVGMYSTYVR